VGPVPVTVIYILPILNEIISSTKGLIKSQRKVWSWSSLLPHSRFQGSLDNQVVAGEDFLESNDLKAINSIDVISPSVSGAYVCQDREDEPGPRLLAGNGGGEEVNRQGKGHS
jgi:hypothetical protein